LANARRFALGVLVTTLIHCGSGTAAPPGDTSAKDASPALDGPTSHEPDGTPPRPDGSVSADASSPPPDAGAISSDAATGGPAIAIGEWTDAPGACPGGTMKVDITSASQLAAAARGGMKDAGRALLDERRLAKPDTPLTQWWVRALAA